MNRCILEHFIVSRSQFPLCKETQQLQYGGLLIVFMTICKATVLGEVLRCQVHNQTLAQFGPGYLMECSLAARCSTLKIIPHGGLRAPRWPQPRHWGLIQEATDGTTAAQKVAAHFFKEQGSREARVLWNRQEVIKLYKVDVWWWWWWWWWCCNTQSSALKSRELGTQFSNKVLSRYSFYLEPWCRAGAMNRALSHHRHGLHQFHLCLWQTPSQSCNNSCNSRTWYQNISSTLPVFRCFLSPSIV